MRSALVMLFLALPLALAQGRITVWTHFGGPELEWLREQARTFERTQGVRVEVVEVPFGEIKQKFILSAPQGQGPDLLVTIPHDWVGEMAQAGVLEPMERYVTQDYLADLQRVAVQAFTFRGRLFGLPAYAESVALIHNRRYVREAPRNWDEFLALARQHTTGRSFGFLYNIGDPYFNFGFFRAFGAENVFARDAQGNLDPSRLLLGGEVGERALAFIRDLRFRHNLVPEGVDYGVADGAFKDGALAMILNGPWALGDYKRAGIDFGIAPFPTPPGARAPWGPFLGVQGVALNAYSRNKTAAANFAKTLVTGRNLVAFNQAGGRIPVSQSAVRQLAGDPVVAGFSRVFAQGAPMPNIPEMGKVWGPWSNAINLAIQRPDSNLRRILEDMTAEIRRALGQ
ncbi:maltose ABC transporter substrate-binding protein [Thermus thermamylovorans]|uniref:Maltose ABC transporter substrate-binding protein n=1 Tax=Thermus thermamylovorans TaxID=2509362 RepID=A0A4Q9B8G5_9DEIN|nr:maltose ABC transporter substrate-binding protein [Thermus thermamylovorans]TBH21168.1 maltose ABC transporter substrate-binding protein [Thermus thermamylovorans]